MNNINDSIMEKIRQLFAMAEHPNSNENEAAIALNKAQELLFRHNLTRGDINNPISNNTPQGIGKIDGIEIDGYIWKRLLLSTIARNTLCKVVVTPSKKQWHLFGSYDNVKATLEMYHWITPELERIALESWKQYKNNNGYETARKWKQGFYLGAIKTIDNRLSESLNTFSAGIGNQLVIYNNTALSNAVHRVFPILGNTRVSSRSSDGYSQGRQAGNNIHLKPQRKLTGILALGHGG